MLSIECLLVFFLLFQLNIYLTIQYVKYNKYSYAVRNRFDLLYMCLMNINYI